MIWLAVAAYLALGVRLIGWTLRTEIERESDTVDRALLRTMLGFAVVIWPALAIPYALGRIAETFRKGVRQ